MSRPTLVQRVNGVLHREVNNNGDETTAQIVPLEDVGATDLHKACIQLRDTDISH